MGVAEVEMAALRARVARLERRNRVVWFLAGAMCGGILLVGTLAASSTVTVTANKFIMRDSEGRTRAILSMTQGGPRLGFYDAAGKMRMRMGLDQQGPPYFRLRDRWLNDRLALGVTYNDVPFSFLTDADWKGGVLTTLDTRDRGYVGISDAAGNVVWDAP